MSEYLALVYATSAIISVFVFLHLINMMIEAEAKDWPGEGYSDIIAKRVAIIAAVCVIVIISFIPMVNTIFAWLGMQKLLNLNSVGKML